MIKDKDMELMIFATGQIYRETGTGSKLISSDATDKREIGLSISNGITRRRSSLRLLGQEVLVDKNMKARLTFGQRSAGIFAVCGVACYVVGSATQNMWVQVIAVFLLSLHSYVLVLYITKIFH